ncbi:hypothetical protein OIO90_004577 [Microbotryomycetes sp. JL221]|nr:hypothetical protein OIO90_004577 [Microbotryomycetes sp. JL221]
MSASAVQQALADLNFVTETARQALEPDDDGTHALVILNRFLLFGDQYIHNPFASKFVRADLSTEFGASKLAWIRQELLDLNREVSRVRSETADSPSFRQVTSISRVIERSLDKVNMVFLQTLTEYEGWISRVQAHTQIEAEWEPVVQKIHHMSTSNRFLEPQHHRSTEQIISLCGHFVILFAFENLLRASGRDIDSNTDGSAPLQCFTVSELFKPAIFGLCYIKMPYNFQIRPGQSDLNCQYQLEDVQWILTLVFDMFLGHGRLQPFFEDLGGNLGRGQIIEHVKSVKYRIQTELLPRMTEFIRSAFPQRLWGSFYDEILQWQASFNHVPGHQVEGHNAIMDIFPARFESRGAVEFDINHYREFASTFGA